MFAANRNRVIALTMALLVMFPISVVAAKWQWSRHLEREAINALVLENTKQPIELTAIAPAGIDPGDEYRPITLVGHFEPASQKLLRKQTLNGEPGYFVLTIFKTESGSSILVNRGWVAAVGRDVDPQAELNISSGTTEISGRVRPLEGTNESDPSDLPIGQTNSARTFAPQLNLDVIVEQTEGQPLAGPQAVPLPEIQAGPHLGYVGQWILIGITSVVVYISVLRNLRREHNQSAN